MKATIVFVLFMFVAVNSFSQSGPFGNGFPSQSASGSSSNTARLPLCGVCRTRHFPVCPGPSTPTPVPIDGGLSILLATGALFGVRRFRNKKAIA